MSVESDFTIDGFFGSCGNSDGNLFAFLDGLDEKNLDPNWSIEEEQGLGPIPKGLSLPAFPFAYSSTADYGGGTSGSRPVQKEKTPQINQQPTRYEVSDKKVPHNSSNSYKSGVFQAPSPNSVLESSSSNSAGKTIIPLEAQITIPVKKCRSKHLRRRPRPNNNPWLRTPIRYSPNKKIGKKRSIPIKQASMKLAGNSGQLRAPNLTKKCTHCQITKTPQWREGPMGPKTLCNACGVRYRSGRLFPEYRPAASPTFVPSLHSNSHRKVIEMRKKFCNSEETMEPEMRKKFYNSDETIKVEMEPEMRKKLCNSETIKVEIEPEMRKTLCNSLVTIKVEMESEMKKKFFNSKESVKMETEPEMRKKFSNSEETVKVEMEPPTAPSPGFVFS